MTRLAALLQRPNPDGVECGRTDLVLVGATWTPHRCTRLRHWRGRHLYERA